MWLYMMFDSELIRNTSKLDNALDPHAPVLMFSATFGHLEIRFS